MKLIQGFKLISRSKSFSLNLFSFFVLILADIFLATIIFYGLSEQISQLTNEYEYFPHKYRQAFIQSTWVENNIITEISDCVLDAPIYYEKPKHKKRHPICDAFDSKINDINGNEAVVKMFEKRKRLQSVYRNYDDYQKNKLNLAEPTYNDIQKITKQIEEHPVVQTIINFVFSEQKKSYINDIKAYKRIFAFKRTGYGFLFLLPIIGLLYFWNVRSNKRGRNLSIIISSHFIIIALLPILFETMRLLLEFLPNVLFKTIYDFLINSKLISLWYYMVIAIIVIAITILIWVLQNKIFTQKRYLRNRIQKAKCTQCGIKTNYRYEFCPNCGNNLLKNCNHCNKLTIEGYEYCQNCGK
jgi:cell fate (sporulation/competence/biofilm development) regulator YmcA (YheA/YmcA/DUF963 family)/predicted RNA-binding Zn-ribbon protein involved in translation (DUF1610 family)